MMFGNMGGDISKNFSELKTEDINEQDFNQIVSVEITLKNKEGRLLTKTHYGKNAKKWHEWIQGVCGFAAIHSANPKWETLKWRLKLK